MSKASDEKKWETTTERFVIFLDIMGFKDFVSRNSHEDVYDLMTKLADSKTLTESLADEMEENEYKDKQLYTASFSDSLVLFTKDNSVESLDILVASGTFILEDAMENNIPMKGAIAFGTISVNKTNQIYFGQPLIDAYLLQEEVNYYGIVCHNSIDKYLTKVPKTATVHKMFFDVSTPLKAGNIQHKNLDWFYFLGHEKSKEEKENKLNECMANLRGQTSGAPRKYIDKTIEVFKLRYSI